MHAGCAREIAAGEVARWRELQLAASAIMPTSVCARPCAATGELSGSIRRMDERDRLAMSAAVDPKIREICCNDRMLGVKFAQADEAEVGQVRFAIGEAMGEAMG